MLVAGSLVMGQTADLVIDAFQYATPAVAQAAWVSGPGGQLVMPVTEAQVPCLSLPIPPLTTNDAYMVADGVGVNTTPGGCNTVAFWMKWDGNGAQMPFGWNAGYDLFFAGGFFGINTWQSNVLGISSAGMAGQWVHVAVVFPNGVPSASNAKMYINGVQQTLADRLSPTTGSQSATSRVFLSGWGPNSSYKFGGTIDDVQVYNRELTASEVLASQASALNISALVANWKLDETSWTVAADTSGNGHNGTLVNQPTWTIGKVGGALSFNTGSYCERTGNWDLSAYHRIAVRMKSAAPSMRMILNFQTTGGGWYSRDFYINDEWTTTVLDMSSFVTEGGAVSGWNNITKIRLSYWQSANSSPGAIYIADLFANETRVPYFPLWQKDAPNITDLMLIYQGSSYRPQMTLARFAPYVSYLDPVSGKEKWLSDGFLFIEYVYQGGYWFLNYSTPACKDQWLGLLEKNFAVDDGIPNLEIACQQTASRIGPPLRRRQVVMTLPVPRAGQTNWGTLNGRALDFNLEADRLAAMNWYMDTAVQMWNALAPTQLELAGFYWVDESAPPTNDLATNNASDSIHARSKKMFWIPYHGAPTIKLQANWREYGFDAAWLQPNYFFNLTVPIARLEDACNEARNYGIGTSYGMGLEMEFDSRMISDPTNYESRFDDYLDAFTRLGVKASSSIAYYEGGGTLFSLATSTNPAMRAHYDRLANFIVDRQTSANQQSISAYWKLDEASGTTATDSSENGHTGTLVNGATWVSGKVGGGLSFNGTNAYVVADGAAVNTAPGGSNTVAFWMKWDGNSTQMPFGWNGGYDLFFAGGFFGINTWQSNVLGISSAGMAGHWVHVAVVFPNGVPSASNAKMYINGVQQTLTDRLSPTTGSRSATSRVFLSGWGPNSSYKFGGIIDDVRIYNRALTASEVAALATP